MNTMPGTVKLSKQELLPMVTALRTVVDAKLAATATFAEREAAWLAVSNQVTCLAIQGVLQELADSCGESMLIEGVPHHEHLKGTVDYHSLCGTFPIHRATYRRDGERSGPTVVPLDLWAGIVERATPALAYDVMQGIAKEDMRSHRETLVAAHRAPPSRSTLERMAQHIGDGARTASARIEAYVRRDEPLPEGAHAISCGLDRVAVPMEELRPEGAPPRSRKRRKPRVRKAPAPVEVKYRMAYIGTVSIVDKDGEVLVTRKYAIPASDDPKTGIANKMAADVKTLKRKNPALGVGVVQDGAPEMWNLLREALAQHPEIGTVLEAIDRFHLMERLGKGLVIVEPDDAVRKSLLREWTVLFEHRDSAIDSVELWLIKRHAGLGVDKAAELWDHLTYIRRNKDRMRYVSMRLAGLPVGSGATEGGCKSVVGKRACGSGQRWHESGLRNVLMLRALHQSRRLPTFWSHMARRYTAKVAVG